MTKVWFEESAYLDYAPTNKKGCWRQHFEISEVKMLTWVMINNNLGNNLWLQ
jgi:hypothetical protein